MSRLRTYICLLSCICVTTTSEPKYRTYDGFSNNLKNPTWGTPNTTYARILKPSYGDGKITPTVAKSGKLLPSPRVISLELYRQEPIRDQKYTLLFMEYGQIITHDMSLALDTIQASVTCCSKGQVTKSARDNERCWNIILGEDDPLRVRWNATCIDFLRTMTKRGSGIFTEQLVEVNHYLDASFIYGHTSTINQNLREKRGGKLRFERRHEQEFPPDVPNKSKVCGLGSPDEPCYMCGDKRVIQTILLAHLQTIFLREHNRVAGILSNLNPHWDDEKIFQEGRKILIAVHQHITYYEWLPNLLSSQLLLQNKIIYKTDTFINDYQEDEDPSVFNEHATAAFRFFHSLIAGNLELVEEDRSVNGSTRLRYWYNRPVFIEKNFDKVGRCMATQAQEAADSRHTIDILDYFDKRLGKFGKDLKAIDIQRGRDHGIAFYNDAREYFGLARARKFDDFLNMIPEEKVRKLEGIYEHPDDVELTVGGSLERLVPNTLSGPIFLRIMLKQFYRTRVADRFWYENIYNGFTRAQLNEIRKASIARLMCDNGKSIKQMQARAFEKISERYVYCAKEAVTVRYLTKRYIGEYSSTSDFLYRHNVTFDNVTTEVEILDTSKCAKNGCLYEHIRWGEAFVIVYSVSDRHSFHEAQEILSQLAKLKLPSYYTSLLLGNKRDLDHSRQICVDDGQELSLQYGCQFYEVSAAENFAGVSLAFQSLLREARSVQLLKALPIRRKLGVNSVSKVLGNIFGKNSKGDRKKRPSLSI